MLFNSLEYAIFLPLVFMCYWLLPHRFRWLCLLIASYYFYMSWNAKYIVLIFFVTVISYFAALAFEKYQCKKLILITSIVLDCSILFVFKYFDFFINSIINIFDNIGIQIQPITLQLILPVGISFYIFQTLSYMIDVYRGNAKPEHHFGVYATFISFFPQLVAGPIERTNRLMPQIKKEQYFNYKQATYGLKLMVWGFFKKIVIADNFSVYVDSVYNNLTHFKGFALIIATILFTVQIYCDFSGYSDIARGTAKLLGIELMQNFTSPYFSASIKEFWSKWHISLSTWFRDYIYIPLGGNKVKKSKHYLNLIITFLVSGLWHGANWTYFLWGGVHGIAQVIENVLAISQKIKINTFQWIIRVIAVFCFSSLAWVFFRAQSISDAIYVFIHMFDGIALPVKYFADGFYEIGIEKKDILLIFTFYLFPLLAFDYASLRVDVIEWIGNQHKIIRWTIYISIVWIILMLTPVNNKSEFIYFQF